MDHLLYLDSGESFADHADHHTSPMYEFSSKTSSRRPIACNPEDIDRSSLLSAKNIECTKEWFAWVIGEKNLFSQFMEYIKYDNQQIDRVLFYETFEVLEDLLSEAIPEYSQLRQSSQTFALQAFLSEEPSSIPDTLLEMEIPPHLMHHAIRIYDFYFGRDSPLDLAFSDSIRQEVESIYISDKIGVTWLDSAAQQVLQDLYTDVFLDFTRAVRNLVDLFHNSASPESSPIPSFLGSPITSTRSRNKSLRRIRSGMSVYTNLISNHSEAEPSGLFLPHRYSLTDSIRLSAEIMDVYGADESSEKMTRRRMVDSATISTLSGNAELEKLFDTYDAYDSDLKRDNRFPDGSRKRKKPKSPLSKVTTSLYLDTGGLSLIRPLYDHV